MCEGQGHRGSTPLTSIFSLAAKNAVSLCVSCATPRALATCAFPLAGEKIARRLVRHSFMRRRKLYAQAGPAPSVGWSRNARDDVRLSFPLAGPRSPAVARGIRDLPALRENAQRGMQRNCQAPAVFRSATPKGCIARQRPRVKSGIATGMLPAATERTERPMMLLQAAAS